MNAKFTWEEAVTWLRSQPNKQELVQDCYYDDPLEKAAERFNQSEEWQAVKLLLKNNLAGRVLDLGAGRGISSYAFARSGYRVTALEPDGSLLVGAGAIKSLSDSVGLEIEIVREYGETLPFGDNSFDIVYGRAVLHHAQDLEKLCQEAFRVLRSGGIFIATREHVIGKKEDLPSFFENHSLHYLYGGENAFLLQEYKEAMINAGFKVQKTLAHFENVINFAPITQGQFRLRFQKKLTSVVGRRFAESLANIKMLQKAFGWFLSLRDKTPGRHYSFLAKKP